MAITAEQKAVALGHQHSVAHDSSQQIRLVAGPGTGKSFAIQERVRWLLEQGISPSSLYAVSFTRASARDLRSRIRAYCEQHGVPAGHQVSVTTLHSLALRVLQEAGLLQAYPTRPVVLDDWELEHVFDAEFGAANSVGKERREDIRNDHEAFWSAGQWDPANYILPVPPISQEERNSFVQFHSARTQAYACVLPGEIVRKCVASAQAGILDPAQILQMRHLIVDEYQDLNPADLQMVDLLVAAGASVFVAGDDDQSIYAFRYASPAGIQGFVNKYPGACGYVLNHCFRCTTSVLRAGTTLIEANAPPQRIPKQSVSLYDQAAPPNSGVVHRWRFADGRAEARAIAQSCNDLIAAGVNPRDILILLSNRKALGRALKETLTGAQVEFCYPENDGFLRSDAGRLCLAILRALSNRDDYVAHRVILGARRGTGIRTCSAVCDSVIANNMNFRDLFYEPLPQGALAGRSIAAVEHARAVCSLIIDWTPDDLLGDRLNAIFDILNGALGQQAGQAWREYADVLPPAMTLSELRDLMWADTEEQQAGVMHDVFARLEQTPPAEGILPHKVRVMTTHGAKGLSGCVAFVPGLEQQILPGPKRQPYPGLVMEAARLLYVSITRARAACIVSYAGRRMMHGGFQYHAPSQFAAHLGGAFSFRQSGLSGAEAAAIAGHCAVL